MKLTDSRAKKLGMVKEDGVWVPSIRTEEIIESGRRRSGGSNAGMATQKLAARLPNFTPEQRRARIAEAFRLTGLSEAEAELASRMR